MNPAKETTLHVPKPLRDRLRKRTAKNESYAASVIFALDVTDLVRGAVLGPLECHLCPRGIARVAAGFSLETLVQHIHDEHREVLKY